MDGPQVSAIMPVHNYGSYVGKAIESVLSQTYHNVELVIIDDASTDHTLDVIRQFDDERIVLIEREECSCSGNTARNDGLKICRGELIAVVDADDINVSTRFEMQVRFFQDHPEVDVLGGGMVKIDETDSPISEPIRKPVFKKHHLYRQMLLQDQAVIFHPTMMFRRHVLRKIPQYSDYPSSADFEFQLKASRYFRLHNLEDVLVYYRQHQNSCTYTYGNRLKKNHHQIFMAREMIWVQKELDRLDKISVAK